MVCVDIFSKFAVAVPMISKDGDDCTAGILESIQKMGKKPELLYTDGETGFDSYALRHYYEEHKIKHYVTRKHAAFAERMIRTFRGMMYARIDQGEVKVENPQWQDYIFQVMVTYNNKQKHSSTNKTPNEARKETHQADVKANLEIRALKNRRYPVLNVGDKVKVMRKKKIEEKERTSNWSIEVFTITAVNEEHGQNYYKVEGMDRDYTRAEVLKV